MGYQVYEHDGRWAGYGVPAECDYPTCTAEIDRGLAYKCETYIDYQYVQNGQPIEPPDYLTSDTEEIEVENEGCGLFFCEEHQHHPDHTEATPKADTEEWLRHLATDESWQKWRETNPERAAAISAALVSSKGT